MLKTLTLASALFFALPAMAAENPFALKDLGNLPQIADNHGGKCGGADKAPAEAAKCGGEKAPAEAAKCGGEKAPAEAAKCGGADKAPAEAAKCGGEKAEPAMKCGAAKCGGAK
ncbi:MAG: hypothetical protein HQL47_07370 [Gammaproteobacteria bacterium]|nr:hypothetical protein [Gammaproteobacteria bacterium]